MIVSIVKALFILSCCSLMACGVYKENGSSKIYFPSDIDAFMEEGHFTTKRPEDIQKKFLRTYNKSCTIFASDTDLVRKYDYYNHLLVFGISKDGKKGYVVTGGQNNNSCQLFSIDKSTIHFATYRIPKNATSWPDIKSHLIINNQLIFGGGVMIKHPYKKQRQAFAKNIKTQLK